VRKRQCARQKSDSSPWSAPSGGKPDHGNTSPRALLTVRTLDRVLVYTVNSRGHVVPLESPSRAYPSISMTGEPSGLSVPLSSHEIDGVRKEK
jgi:hypothetical protein